jgi:23S rRNA (pseudouridine1915-N3)-methyltransferase
MRGRGLLILWVGRHHRGSWEQIASRYRKRITRTWPLEELPVKSRFQGEGRARLRAEAEAIFAALPDPVWLVALDRRGERLSSEDLARRMSRWRREWPHPIAFVIGSDLGLDASVRKAARLVLSLGPMTLSHELARLVLYEQLYRVASIEAGTGYHRAPQ